MKVFYQEMHKMQRVEGRKWLVKAKRRQKVPHRVVNSRSPRPV